MSNVKVPYRPDPEVTKTPESLFGRSYELYIGKPVPVKKIYGPADTVLLDNYVDIRAAKRSTPNTYLFKDNHITFSCKKDSKTESNKADIAIYNPDKEVLDYIESFSTLKLSCIFKAGYNGNNKEIFRGTIEDFEYDASKPDKVLKLKIADGSNNIAEAQTQRFYPAGTEYAKILRDLSSDLGLPLGVPINQQGASKKPMYFSGKASVNIAFLAKAFHADFSIQDGAAWYLPENVRLKEEVYKITPSTGLLYDVTPYSEKSNTTANDTQNIKKQIKLTCLLNGTLSPGKTIYVESVTGKYKGYYKVVEVEHKGMFEGTGLWASEIIAKDVGNNVI